MTGISNRFASCTAMCSMRVSSTKTAPGTPRMSLMPLRYFWSLTISFCIFMISFFFSPYWLGSASLASSFFILSMLLPDGLEVRQHPAEPALVDEEHVGAQGFFLKDFSGLPLGSDKQDRLAGGDGVADEGIGLFHPSQCLLKIDDVDAVAFAEEELLHLRVPPIRLVPEMDTRF